MSIQRVPLVVLTCMLAVINGMLGGLLDPILGRGVEQPRRGLI